MKMLKEIQRNRRVLTGCAIVCLSVLGVLLWTGPRKANTAEFLQDIFPARHGSREPVTLLFAGDVMLGRHVRKLIEANSPAYPFERVTPTIETLAPDFFIANLEGPITELNAPDTRVSPEQPYSMRFAFHPSVVRGLVDVGFTHLSVANNHALDQGRAGATDTIAHLAGAGITAFGSRDGSALGSVARMTKGGHDIIFIGLDTTVDARDTAALSAELKTLPEDAFIVVFLHWGNEYEKIHSPQQETFAHALIDGGVDLIVGSHPHVVQDIETYKDKKIYYSLGNFVFDQYWNEDVRSGLMVLVTLDGDNVTYENIPVTSIRSQPQADDAKG